MPFGKVTQLLEHGIYWARTLKVPYLSLEESSFLLAEIKKITDKSTLSESILKIKSMPS